MRGQRLTTARDWKGACDGIDELDRGGRSAALVTRRPAVAALCSRGHAVRRSLRATEVRSLRAGERTMALHYRDADTTPSPVIMHS